MSKSKDWNQSKIFCCKWFDSARDHCAINQYINFDQNPQYLTFNISGIDAETDNLDYTMTISYCPFCGKYIKFKGGNMNE